MPDAERHADDRPWLESMIRKIPGFQGYLEMGYRRESDRLQREWLADRLQRSKQGLSDYTLTLTNAGHIDQLPVCDQMRNRLDRVISRLRGSVSGYSGFFDFVQVDEERLDEVYAHDLSLTERVESLAERIENLPQATEAPTTLMPQLMQAIGELEEQVDAREDLLKGMSA